MMRNVFRQLADILATLIGLNANQRIIAVLLTVAGIITLDWFSNGSLAIITGNADVHQFGFWLQILALPAVLILFYFVTRAFYFATKEQNVQPISANIPPSPHRGVIIFLSTFHTFTNKLPPARENEVWQDKDIIDALERDVVDWPGVMDHIQASNMQTPLEAVRHHYDSGALRTIWVLATDDAKNEQGEVMRRGSRHLVPAFRRLIREGFGWNVEIIYEKNSMSIPAYNVQAVFEAVQHVYETAPRYGIHPRSVIADITGGTVTMSAGMTLYCALTQRPMQYTATQVEPAQGKPLDAPTPFGIHINYQPIQRNVLRQLLSEGVSST